MPTPSQIEVLKYLAAMYKHGSGGEIGHLVLEILLKYIEELEDKA